MVKSFLSHCRLQVRFQHLPSFGQNGLDGKVKNLKVRLAVVSSQSVGKSAGALRSSRRGTLISSFVVALGHQHPLLAEL